MGLIRWTTDYFQRHHIDQARTDAEILLAHALGLRRIDLYLNHDQPLHTDELKPFKAAIQRRINREPVAYITGVREFWSLELAVNPAVLIPRPETECLVEAVLPTLNRQVEVPMRVLELGTGSGAIIVALAHEHPYHRYVGMDRSLDALYTARQNARKHEVDSAIGWFCGNWDAALAPERATFNLIVSNPPYIRSAEIDALQPEIRHFEPRSALDGSGNGLDCLGRILETAHRYLGPGGVLALEMGHDQAADVVAIAAQTGRYHPVRIFPDYGGHDRVAVMEKRR